jgi:hypothetical protein
MASPHLREANNEFRDDWMSRDDVHEDIEDNARGAVDRMEEDTGSWGG